MVVDLSPLVIADQQKSVPGKLLGAPVPYVTAQSLTTFLKKEAPKQFKDKAKIRYVDCQSFSENTGNEIQGALHMNLNNPLKWGPLKFNGLIKSLPDVYNDLGSADVLVFYCVIGSARSPAMCHLYREAVKTVADRPRNYNTKQKVMVIDGGITEFAKQQAGLKPVIILPWVAPNQGKVVTGGKGSIQVDQPGGEDPTGEPKTVQPGGDTDDYVIYTDS